MLVNGKVLLFLLLVGIVLIRSPGINEPLVGFYHLRMNETAAIARNFAENSMSILYPQIDWGGNGTGYIEEAFQLYAFLVAVLYKIFGVSEALGRGLSIVFFTASAWLVFLLTQRLDNQRAALFSVFFFGIAPMGLYFGRSFQPDSLILFCSIASIYLFIVWSETDTEVAIWGSAVALAAATLMKPMHLYLGLPVLYLCYRRFGLLMLFQWRLWLFGVVTIVPMLWYYIHAHRLYLEYGNTNGMWTLPWMFGSIGHLFDLSLYSVMAKRLVSKITTVPGLPLLILGFLLRPQASNYVIHIWAIGFAISVIVTAGAQMAHDYYQLPALIFVSVWMGVAASYLFGTRLLEKTFLPEPVSSRVLVLIFCILAAISGGKTVQTAYGAFKHHTDQLAFARRLAEITKPGSLVIIGSNHSRGLGPAGPECCRHREPDGLYLHHQPVEFYQSHRKGYSVHYEDLSMEVIEILRKRGANYFALVSYYPTHGSANHLLEQKSEFLQSLANRFVLLERAEKWVVFRLMPK